MPYEDALNRAWKTLNGLSACEVHSVSFLSDMYEVNLKARGILSNSCNAPAKDYVAILLLHYLIGTLKNGYLPSGEWISFKGIEGGATYYPAYRNSVVKPLLKKYGSRPKDILSAIERFKARQLDLGDASVEIETFPDVLIRIVLWGQDAEFGPEATILYDKDITRIYTMEDITVFSQFIVHNL